VLTKILEGEIIKKRAKLERKFILQRVFHKSKSFLGRNTKTERAFFGYHKVLDAQDEKIMRLKQ
jgi:hypothetical protein